MPRSLSDRLRRNVGVDLLRAKSWLISSALKNSRGQHLPGHQYVIGVAARGICSSDTFFRFPDFDQTPPQFKCRNTERSSFSSLCVLLWVEQLAAPSRSEVVVVGVSHGLAVFRSEPRFG